MDPMTWPLPIPYKTELLEVFLKQPKIQTTILGPKAIVNYFVLHFTSLD